MYVCIYIYIYIYILVSELGSCSKLGTHTHTHTYTYIDEHDKVSEVTDTKDERIRHHCPDLRQMRQFLYLCTNKCVSIGTLVLVNAGLEYQQTSMTRLCER